MKATFFLQFIHQFNKAVCEKKKSIVIPYSKFVEQILDIFYKNNYIYSYRKTSNGCIEIFLKYINSQSVVKQITFKNQKLIPSKQISCIKKINLELTKKDYVFTTQFGFRSLSDFSKSYFGGKILMTISLH